MNRRDLRGHAGFTLLEVLIGLTVMAVGVALTLSAISGALGNVRKVQMRTRLVEHAETVMELALLDDSVSGPTTLTGDFEDGTRWTVVIADFVPPETEATLNPRQPLLPLKLLSYSVQIFAPGSGAPDYGLQTLKVVRAQQLGLQVPQ
jgi:prepilin-type N-terminal cleavage/methylation domain-containing protein